MQIRLVAAVCAAKIAKLACRAIGSRATALPGKVARRICPDFNTRMAKQVRGKILVTCGTNGKTTTNNLMYACLKKAGKKCVCNNGGANMLTGIAAAFAEAASFTGKLDTDFACFEIDEAYLRHAFREFTPDVVAVTNLFRDQLDRYGEVDATKKLLEEAFSLAPEAIYILNADDPLTSSFGIDKNAVYYGIGEALSLRRCEENAVQNTCTLCGAKLQYAHISYDRIGKYVCPSCGYENPKAAVTAKNIVLREGVLCFEIENSMQIRTPITGIYNIYNILSATAAMRSIGVADEICESVFNAQKPEPGRMSQFHIADKTAYLILSKNPTGFNQSVMTVLNDEREKNILISINDAAGDGEDVSWIWDVDFESLRNGSIAHVVLSGVRCYDMYLRLQYGGFDMDKVSVYPETSAAVDALLHNDAGIGYALVNYTAMYPTYLAMEKKVKEQGGEQ